MSGTEPTIYRMMHLRPLHGVADDMEEADAVKALRDLTASPFFVEDWPKLTALVKAQVEQEMADAAGEGGEGGEGEGGEELPPPEGRVHPENTVPGDLGKPGKPPIAGHQPGVPKPPEHIATLPTKPGIDNTLPPETPPPAR